MISRRVLLAGGFACLAGSAAGADRAAAIGDALGELEGKHGGRLGVAILDAGIGQPVSRRGDERFLLDSTSKLLMAAFILARVERGQETLARRIVYDRADILSYAPVTGRHVGPPGMTLGDICAAAMTLSDNTAANLMLASFGGPPALTRWLREIGDGVTRLDRGEPALNDPIPGDPHDSTTPVAMAMTMRRLLVGPVLTQPSRQRLFDWMEAATTGRKRLRAALAPGWRAGDKTGTGPGHVANDVAMFRPPDGRAPILVAAFYEGAGGSDAERDAVHADIGRLVMAS